MNTRTWAMQHTHPCTRAQPKHNRRLLGGQNGRVLTEGGFYEGVNVSKSDPTGAQCTWQWRQRETNNLHSYAALEPLGTAQVHSREAFPAHSKSIMGYMP